MSRDIIAVEVQGWDRNYWNLLPDSRNLCNWIQGSSNTSCAYTATGISGLPNTATVITDEAVSPSAFAYVQSPTLHIEDENHIAARIWVLKDAVSSPDAGLRIYLDGAVWIGYGIDTSTGALTLDGASNALYYGSKSTQRARNGQTWFEVWIWARIDALDGEEVYIRIYPALFTGATAVRSVTVGNVELYDSGSASTSTSPESGAWTDIDGDPPNYGDVFLANETFATEEAGTSNYNLFPSIYPWPVRVGPTDTIFEGRLSQAVNYSVRVAPHFWSSRTAVGLGSIEVINDSGDLDAWREWEWRDRHVTIKLHNTSKSYLPTFGTTAEGAETLLRAIVERMDVLDEQRMRIIIRDPVPALYLPINSYYPAASASPDPYLDAHYRAIPITFGDPKQCAPVLVNASTFSYELHDGNLNAVTEVYISGVPQSTASPTYTASGAGFTFGSEASGRVTADPQSTATADLDALCTSITDRVTVTFDAITRAQYNALSHSSPEVTYKYAYYIDDTITPAKILDMLVSSFGGWWFVNRFGEVVFGQLKAPGTVLENLLINSPDDPRDLTTWGGTAQTSYKQTGVDGERTATNVTDSDSGGNEICISALMLISGDTVTLRMFILKDTTSPPTPNIRLVDQDANVMTRLDLALDTGTISGEAGTGGNRTNQATERTLGGQQWWELIMQVDRDSDTSCQVVIFPAGTTASNTGTITVGGVEVYDGATLAEVEGTPPNLETSRLITDAEIIGDVRISPDHAPGLSDGMGANKNWSPGRTSEGTGLNGEKFSRAYQDEYRTSTAMADAYDHAVGADLPDSLLTDSTAAQTEADRIALLYQRERYFFRVPIALEHVNFDEIIDSIGQTYSLTSDRFNLSSLPVVLVGVSGAFMLNEVELTFWG